MSKYKHLTLAERVLIQDRLNNGFSVKKIAKELGRPTTTISRELQKNSIPMKKGCYGRPFNDCAKRTKCNAVGICLECSQQNHSKCSLCALCNSNCTEYKKEVCPKLEKAPYVCNSCSDRYKCTLEKMFYMADKANEIAEMMLKESRSGCNITEEERLNLDELVSPLIMKGQSPYHIITSHKDEIQCSINSLYRYISKGLFECQDMDLRSKVKLKPRKGEKKELKVDKQCRINRTYEDFREFNNQNPGVHITEIDSVEGVKGGSVLLTIMDDETGLQLAFLRKRNDSKSVTEAFNSLYQKLGEDDYKKLFPVLLGDNGTEFSNPKALEFNETGNHRSKVYYCDPSSPGQKGHCERNHEFIRNIIPKGEDIGKYDQDDINVMMDHINSYARQKFNGKTPYEMFEFIYGKELLDKLGVNKIPRDEVVMKPSLLKKRLKDKEDKEEEEKNDE